VKNILKYRNFNNSYTNPKPEILNSKQIRISKFKCSKHYSILKELSTFVRNFEFWSFGFKNYSPREMGVI
jgi:hypothetical protein